MAVMLALIACSEKQIAEANWAKLLSVCLFFVWATFFFILSLSNQIPTNMELHGRKGSSRFTLVQSNQAFNSFSLLLKIKANKTAS